MLTETDIKTFGIYSLREHLRKITKSCNYNIVLEEHDIQLRYFTKKYLKPIDIQNGRNFTILSHFNISNRHDYLTLLHSLILCNYLKGMKEGNMPLHTFIEEVISWVGMCISLISYGYNVEGKDSYISRNLYNLPCTVKKEIYNYMKENITNIKYGVYTDGEGNSYNSCSIAEVK